MVLDAATRRNLELTQTLRTTIGMAVALGARSHQPPWGRGYSARLEQPLLEQEPVERCLDAVAGL